MLEIKADSSHLDTTPIYYASFIYFFLFLDEWIEDVFTSFQILRYESIEKNSGDSDLFTDSSNPNVFIVLSCNLIAGSFSLGLAVPLRFRFRFFSRTDCLGAPALFTRTCLCGLYSVALLVRRRSPARVDCPRVKRRRNHCRDFLGHPDGTPVLIDV